MRTAHIVCPRITEECEEWLDSIGYFDKPASLSHHGMMHGDLYRHCLTVAGQLQTYTRKLDLVWEREDSPIVVGLLHDVCKCDDYIWNGKKWIFNKHSMRGHGDKSVFMLEGHIELTEEEIYCIKYHMGAFVEKTHWNQYSNAVHKYPNVLYTHTADMVASQIYNI